MTDAHGYTVPVSQMRVCSICQGWYFLHPPEAFDAHRTVMGHQPVETPGATERKEAS